MIHGCFGLIMKPYYLLSFFNFFSHLLILCHFFMNYKFGSARRILKGKDYGLNLKKNLY